MGLQLKSKTFTASTANNTSIHALATLGGAGNFPSLTTAAGDGSYNGTNVASKITLTSAGNLSTVNFTVTGTDVNGDAQSESITGLNANTISTTKFYRTVTQVAADAAVGTNTSIGNSADASGVIFAGRTRVRGAHGTSGATVGTIDFLDGSSAGTSKFSFLTATTTADYIEPYIPDDGILFKNGAYVDLPGGVAGSLTAFFDG